MIYGTSASLLFTFVLSCGGVLLFFGRTVFGRRISDNVQGLCVRAGKKRGLCGFFKNFGSWADLYGF